VLDKATAATTTQANAKDGMMRAVGQGLDVLGKQRDALSSAARSATESLRNAVEFYRNNTENATELALEKVASAWSNLLTFPAGTVAAMLFRQLPSHQPCSVCCRSREASGSKLASPGVCQALLYYRASLPHGKGSASAATVCCCLHSSVSA
jgi:hypothetical protein